MKIKLFILIFIISLPLSFPAFGQQTEIAGLRIDIRQAIQKGYDASVRIWGFDTVKNVRNGPQFSGAVVSPEGHVLTAAHAIQPNRVYKVSFPDGREYISVGLGKIALAGTANIPDAAMIKIISTGSWPYVEMGWSYSLNDNCIGISYPEALAQPRPSVRFGRITGVNIRGTFIRSTCVMEPGDSGGALFDGRGRLIGLHSRCEKSEDSNLEIPIDIYRKYWTALNAAINYNTLPETIDEVNLDTLSRRGESLSGTNLLASNSMSLFKKYKGAPIGILSKLKGAEIRVLGTAVDVKGLKLEKYQGRGLVVSKSSCVGEDVAIIDKNGRRTAALVLDRNAETDLVLLITQMALPGSVTIDVRQSDTLDKESIGTFVQCPQIDSLPRNGVISTGEISLPLRYSSGYFGAIATFRGGRVVLTKINPGSPAADSLILGDVLLAIGGEPLYKPEDYQHELQKYFPGERVPINILRGKDSLTRIITLTRRLMADPGHLSEQFSGGTSVRKDGFMRVFATDSRLRPEECGGPIIDEKGQLKGISIARFSRTTTLVTPVNEIRRFLISAFKAHR